MVFCVTGSLDTTYFFDLDNYKIAGLSPLCTADDYGMNSLVCLSGGSPTLCRGESIFVASVPLQSLWCYNDKTSHLGQLLLAEG